MKLQYSKLQLADYQLKAVQQWKGNNHHGIISFPIGLGGTITALVALSEVERPSITLIICSDKQSEDRFFETVENAEDAEPHRVSLKKKEDISSLVQTIEARAQNECPHDVIITSFVEILDSDMIGEELAKSESISQVFIPGLDSLPTTVLRQLSGIEFDRALGLSYIPKERINRVYRNDPDRVDTYESVFDGNTFSYALTEAIDHRFLRRFRYHPIVTRNDPVSEEQESKTANEVGSIYQDDFSEFSERIRRETRAVDTALQAIRALLVSEFDPPVVFISDLAQSVELIADLLQEQNLEHGTLTAVDPKNDQILEQFNENDINYLVTTTAAVQGFEFGRVETAVVLSTSDIPIAEYQVLGQALSAEEFRRAKQAPVDIYDIVPIPAQQARASSGEVNSFLRRSIGLMKVLIDASENQHRTEYQLYRQLEEFNFGHLVYE